MAFYKQGNHARVMFMSIIFSTKQWTVQHLLFLLSSSSLFLILSITRSKLIISYKKVPFIELGLSSK